MLLGAMVNTDYGRFLLSTFSLIITIECFVSLELKEVHVPTYVVLGMDAQLLCHWKLSPIDTLYSVKWYKDGKEFFRYVPLDLEPMREFPLPGVDVENFNSSGSSIVLAPVTFESAGRYRCEVSDEKPHFPTVSNYADMTVVDPPHEDPVVTGLKQRYHLGERVQINCTSGRSRPPCQLQWYINGEPVPSTRSLPPIYQLHENERASTTSGLDFILTEQYFKKKVVKVKCLATLFTLYSQSNEKCALLEKENIHHRLLPNYKKPNSEPDISENLGSSLVSSSWQTCFMFITLLKKYL